MTPIPSTRNPPTGINRQVWEKVSDAIDLIEKAGVKQDGTPLIIYTDSSGTYLCSPNATYRLLSGTFEVENGDKRLTLLI